MKIIVLVALMGLLGMVAASPVLASEEIMLASAIGKSSSTKVDVVKKEDDDDPLAAILRGMTAQDKIAAGIFTAATIKILLGLNSTSNH